MTFLEKFSDHILNIADNENIPVSNLLLNTTMFITLQEELHKHLELKNAFQTSYNESTPSEKFIVIRHGAHVPDIYNKYRIWGSISIIETGIYHPEFSVFDETIKKYLKISPFSIIKMITNQSFWILNEDKILYGKSNITYPVESFTTPYIPHSELTLNIAQLINYIFNNPTGNEQSFISDLGNTITFDKNNNIVYIDQISKKDQFTIQHQNY